MDKTELALKLFEIKAFKDYRTSPEGKGWVLAAHRENLHLPLSPFYLNLRTPDNKDGPLKEDVVSIIGQHLFRVAVEQKLVFEAVVGIPNAGDPLAKAFHNAIPNNAALEEESEQRKHLLDLKRDGKEKVLKLHKALFGSSRVGGRTLMIDDVVSDGASKHTTAQFLRSNHQRVTDCLVIVDRRPFQVRKEAEKEAQEQAKMGGIYLNIHSIFKIQELVEIGLQHGELTPEVADRILQYLNA